MGANKNPIWWRQLDSIADELVRLTAVQDCPRTRHPGILKVRGWAFDRSKWRPWLTILHRRTIVGGVAMLVSFSLPGFAQAPHDTPRRTGQVIILSETVIGGRVPMIDQLQSMDQYCGSPPGDDGRGRWWRMSSYPRDDPGLPQICRYQRRVRFSLVVTAPVPPEGQSTSRPKVDAAGTPLAPNTRLDPESVWPGRSWVEQPREPAPRLDSESVWPRRPLPVPNSVPRLNPGPVVQ